MDVHPAGVAARVDAPVAIPLDANGRPTGRPFPIYWTRWTSSLEQFLGYLAVERGASAHTLVRVRARPARLRRVPATTGGSRRPTT